MATTYKTPGVYVEEISKFPPSVAQVETAIPAFVGYTEKASKNGQSLTNVPFKVKSMLEFETYFGKGAALKISGVTANSVSNGASDVTITPTYYLYDSLQLYYANGGGDCYIVSIGNYDGTGSVLDDDFLTGLEKLKLYDEPTIILFPDAVKLINKVDPPDPLVMYDNLKKVQQAALKQCGDLMDRFAILDLLNEDSEDDIDGNVFRSSIGMTNLKYGAAYTPWLNASLSKRIMLNNIEGTTAEPFSLSAHIDSSNMIDGEPVTDFLTNYLELLSTNAANLSEVGVEIGKKEQSLIDNIPYYKNLIGVLQKKAINYPPSGAIAGIYCATDNSRGVWKAPANISLSSVNGVTNQFTSSELDALNVDVNAGKSINAIRPITGKGIMVMGARTLAGNDNEWRYIPVRRLFNMVEESCKKSTDWAVFEPNDANLWLKVKSMIENFLYNLWRQGALAGAKPEHAYYVKCGLNITMTAVDILEGKLNVEIGMAAVRPAEFIVLKFSHKLQES